MRTLSLIAGSILLLTAVGCAHEHHERHAQACYQEERVDAYYAYRPHYDRYAYPVERHPHRWDHARR